MAICRFSSDNWRCDVYCYEAEEGYVTHVAGSRVVGDVPVAPFFLDVPHSDFFAAMKEQSDFVANADREVIGLPFDGQSFVDNTTEQLYERLKMLVEVGYVVPMFVFAELGEEMRGQLK